MNATESLSHVGPVLRARGLEKEYGQGWRGAASTS